MVTEFPSDVADPLNVLPPPPSQGVCAKSVTRSAVSHPTASISNDLDRVRALDRAGDAQVQAVHFDLPARQGPRDAP